MIWRWWKDRHLRELQAENEAMRRQIRLMKTRHFPDIVWVEAFSLGFSKAWDMMMLYMEQGIKEVAQKSKDKAIQDTISNLHPFISQMAEELRGNSLPTD